jgi:tetratricopeptide (TPR) repeat protein
MARGKEMLRSDFSGGSAQAIEIFSEAVKLQPKDATAWGLLSQAQRYVSEASPRDNTAAEASEQSARRALALDRREPNALLTMASLQRVLDDWYTTDQKLREILTIAPDNIAAHNLLVALLQASGYVRESWDLNERPSRRPIAITSVPQVLKP